MNKPKACIIPLHKANNSYYSVRKRRTQYSIPPYTLLSYLAMQIKS